MSQVVNPISLLNIETILDRSEPNTGYTDEVVVPLLSCMSTTGRDTGMPPLLGLDLVSSGPLSQPVFVGTDREANGFSGGHVVLSMAATSSRAEGFIVPWTFPYVGLCGAASGVYKPSIQVGVAWRETSGTAQSTLKLQVTPSFRPKESTAALVTLSALESAAWGATLATTGGFRWAWFDVLSGATAAQKASVNGGCHFEFLIGTSADVTTTMVQVSDILIRYRRHATLKAKGDRW